MAKKIVVESDDDNDIEDSDTTPDGDSDSEAANDTPGDSISTSQSASETPAPSQDVKPQPDSSKVMDYQKYLITPEDLDKMQSAKKTAAIATGLGNALGNQQSAGNFWLGHMNPKNDMSGVGNMLSNAASAPIQAKQMMMSQTLKQPEMQLMGQLQDSSSMPSQLVKANALSALSQIKAKTPEQQAAYAQMKQQIGSGNLSGFQVRSLIDSDPLLKESFSASIAGQKLDQMMAMIQNRTQNQGELAAQRTVNNDKILNTYIPRLDGASKIMGLMQAGERGEFATNKALLGQLNQEISRLETGSQSPGLNQSEKTEMNSLGATLSDLRDSVTGGVTGVDLSKKFAQAKGMVGDLAKSYYQQIDDRMDQLKSGANLPGQSDVIGNKQKTMQDVYQKRFANVGMNVTGQGGEKSGGLINSANAGETNPPEGMVDVISPEGAPGKIPISKLPKALNRGFKVQNGGK